MPQTPAINTFHYYDIACDPSCWQQKWGEAGAWLAGAVMQDNYLFWVETSPRGLWEHLEAGGLLERDCSHSSSFVLDLLRVGFGEGESK